MSESSSFYQSTSQNLELEVLNRFRDLTAILPHNCQIYRETWNNQTILCLNFESCPHHIEVVKENFAILVNIVKRLSIATSIIFREGNQPRGWRKC